jgi:hypothetical protein
MSADKNKGQWLRAFSIPLLQEDMAAYMDRHFPDIEEESHDLDKGIMFYELLSEILRDAWERRLAHVLVPIRGGFVWETAPIVIATNKMEEDLKGADGPELFRKIQRIIGVQTEAAWYMAVE